MIRSLPACLPYRLGSEQERNFSKDGQRREASRERVELAGTWSRLPIFVRGSLRGVDVGQHHRNLGIDPNVHAAAEKQPGPARKLSQAHEC